MDKFFEWAAETEERALWVAFAMGSASAALVITIILAVVL